MKRMLLVSALLLVVGLVGIPPASAGPVTMKFTKPNNAAEATVKVTIGSVTIPVKIPPGKDTDAETKRNLIAEELDKSYDVTKKGKFELTIDGLKKGTVVNFNLANTGEESDRLVADAALGGSFGFANASFSSVDAFGETSVFTGGIVTDVGELSASILASSLPALDGTTITQALFAALNPSASTFGATITNGGDFLNVVFDPAKTIGIGGVVFGTTALTEGAFGSVIAGEPVPEPATLLLLASGLAGVAGFRKRRGPTRQA